MGGRKKPHTVWVLGGQALVKSNQMRAVALGEMGQICVGDLAMSPNPLSHKCKIRKGVRQEAMPGQLGKLPEQRLGIGWIGLLTEAGVKTEQSALGDGAGCEVGGLSEKPARSWLVQRVRLIVVFEGLDILGSDAPRTAEGQ